MDHHDKWQLNSDGTRVDFTETQLLEQFKQYQSQIRDEMKEQNKLTARQPG